MNPRVAIRAALPFAGLFVAAIAVHQQHVHFGEGVLDRGILPPIDPILEGVRLGCISALLAVAIALVFRANRVVNFAQAEMGAISSTFATLLILSAGWNYYLALASGLVASVLVGVLTEFLFVRRFFRSPRLILTVATIGIAQFLVGGSLGISRLLDDAKDTKFAPPLDLQFTVGVTNFDGNDVLVFAVTPLVLVALGVFLRYSAVGIGIRASAENADRASLVGVPVKRIQTYVWVIASLLGFVAMFLRTGAIGTTFGRVLAPSTLLAALAAAAFGKLERLPTIVLAAIGIGILDQVVQFEWEQEAYQNGVLALVVIAAVLVMRDRSGSRVSALSVSSWQTSREIRPIPSELRSLPQVRAAKRGGLTAALVIMATIPLWMSGSDVRKAGAIGIYAMIAISLVVLAGWGGHVSLGQIAVVGLGAAAGGSVTANSGADLAVGLLLGGVVGAVALVIVGLPTLRTGGLSLGITTLALALVGTSYLINESYSPIRDRLPGFDLNREPPALFGGIYLDTNTRFYGLIVVMLIITIVVVQSLRQSRTGRVLIGLRENDRAAQAFGVSTRRAAMNAYAISGFIAGVAGSLLFHQQGALDAGSYAPEEGLKVFAMAVVGGLGSIGGAIVGAIFIRGIDWFITGDWAFLSFLASGLGMLLVLVLFPGGLGAALGLGRDSLLRRLARQKGIRVPSLVADTRVDTGFTATAEMRDAVADATEIDPVALESSV